MAQEVQAVIQLNGKQYLVREGEVFRTTYLRKKQGSTFQVKDVLLLSGSSTEESPKPLIGDPKVKGAKVELEVVKSTKAKKITIMKYKHKTNYKRKLGYRERVSFLRVNKIELS